MHENACLSEGCGNACSLIDRDALFHFDEQAIRGGFEPCRDGNAPGRSEQTAQVRREGFFETDVAPP